MVRRVVRERGKEGWNSEREDVRKRRAQEREKVKAREKVGVEGSKEQVEWRGMVQRVGRDGGMELLCERENTRKGGHRKDRYEGENRGKRKCCVRGRKRKR